ncbi:hypothetical protein POM88_016092 [Heracleum sosnowskyi]|uniref:Uncharacterized protein n=1 Tax=Heracleum sosnowskyi TaxID=360622 RepID=A0AAD8IMV0_9APIA|nr:hypothetical protein POM88_016092 [Heracleum sosnowskyi]
MKIENNNLGSLPIDMIIVIMKLLLSSGFEDFFNFLKALAQTQRMSAVIHLLEEFLVRDLYMPRILATQSDVTCFNRFVGIGENLRIYDAILYARSRDIICGFGNIDGHLTEVDLLAANGHFLSMVGKFILGILYKKESCSDITVEAIVCIYKHPHNRRYILSALTHMRDMKSCIKVSSTAKDVDINPTCIIHPKVANALFTYTRKPADDCLFCNIAAMLNVFMNTEE